MKFPGNFNLVLAGALVPLDCNLDGYMDFYKNPSIDAQNYGVFVMNDRDRYHDT